MIFYFKFTNPGIKGPLVNEYERRELVSDRCFKKVWPNILNMEEVCSNVTDNKTVMEETNHADFHRNATLTTLEDFYVTLSE